LAKGLGFDLIWQELNLMLSKALYLGLDMPIGLGLLDAL
jgi:hypothetical protein